MKGVRALHIEACTNSITIICWATLFSWIQLTISRGFLHHSPISSEITSVSFCCLSVLDKIYKSDLETPRNNDENKVERIKKTVEIIKSLFIYSFWRFDFTEQTRGISTINRTESLADLCVFSLFVVPPSLLCVVAASTILISSFRRSYYFFFLQIIKDSYLLLFAI